MRARCGIVVAALWRAGAAARRDGRCWKFAGGRLPNLLITKLPILDVTDIVFIDRDDGIQAGRFRERADKASFMACKRDVQSVGDFIRLWADAEPEMGFAKILAGESYGTTRAAGLSGYLQQRYE